MNPAYLIDTDWIIHFLTGHSEIVQKLTSLQNAGLAVSVVSLAELYEGVFNSSDPAASEENLDDFLNGLILLEVDEPICKIFGKERGKLRKDRKLIGDFDLLIASTCLRHGLTLLTNNRKHYQRIDGLRIISA